MTSRELTEDTEARLPISSKCTIEATSRHLLVASRFVKPDKQVGPKKSHPDMNAAENNGDCLSAEILQNVMEDLALPSLGDRRKRDQVQVNTEEELLPGALEDAKRKGLVLSSLRKKVMVRPLTYGIDVLGTDLYEITTDIYIKGTENFQTGETT